MKESTIIKISKFLDENGFELLNHKNNTLRIRHLSCDTEFDLNYTSKKNIKCIRCNPIEKLKKESSLKIYQLNEKLKENNQDLVARFSYIRTTKDKVVIENTKTKEVSKSNRYENIIHHNNTISFDISTKNETIVQHAFQEFGFNPDPDFVLNIAKNLQFPDCKSKQPLRFDLALRYYESIVLIIEIDLDSHFYDNSKNKMFNEYVSLNDRIKKDSIKDKYCLYREYPLLRLTPISSRSKYDESRLIKLNNNKYCAQLIGTTNSFNKSVDIMTQVNKETNNKSFEKFIKDIKDNIIYCIN
ncbi:protein of unknown function [Acetoanaerobium sticklandii]|uniref:DUF2726 domain-containing protein n=1 Tax=Acetoanaerobium sticklandii (strain ATCC 12662 / DSM 519 / JCM 1433 / CCUG 9281 / NCIMB 10654 / HF) TaxID=499177 RepID=E3PY51_ACESD|nr:hypothetical protein [Acetoanaerobium sticklandii]CBH21366.1 protein of unknown function [Acetoanaerobium sticklandii]